LSKGGRIEGAMIFESTQLGGDPLRDKEGGNVQRYA